MKPDLAILCGGQGLRLRGILGDHLPKPMVDIHGAPFLRILVENALAQGVEHLVFCAGYKEEAIRDYFSRDALLSKHCFFSSEKTPMGTAGALKVALPQIHTANFIAINGDSYCAVDFNALFNAHLKTGARATVVVAPAHERRDGGYVSLNKDGTIRSFTEKEYAAGAFINAGIYVFQKELLNQIPDDRPFSLEKDFITGLIGDRAHAYKTNSALYDIGTPERLEQFKQFMKGQ